MSILEGIKILKDLNENELNNLELLCQERFIKAGELLFKHGDEANSMYLLKSGEIEVFIEKNNEEIILGNIKAEDILGEMALLGERKKRMASARAIKDTVIIVLLEFALDELTKNHPDILEKIRLIIEGRKQHNKNII